MADDTTLQSALARSGPLRPEWAVALLRQIAAEVDAANAAQVAHRNINPANIVLTGDGRAYLAAADPGSIEMPATAEDFAYLAPERITENDTGPAADVYALACVLYTALAGAPPYPPAAGVASLITAHLSAPIPHLPSALAGFDAIVARGLAKEPQDRYRSSGELAAAAEYALTAPDPTPAVAAPQPPPYRPYPQPIPPGPYSPAPVGRPRRRLLLLLVLLPSIVFVIMPIIIGVVAFVAVQPPDTTPGWASQQSELPFTDLRDPHGLAVDQAGNVYVSDLGRPGDSAGRVLKLVPGTSGPIPLPFPELGWPSGVAVDDTGSVYVADSISRTVLKLAAGAPTPTVLPFTGLDDPTAVAVDTADNVYVTDNTDHKVLKLAPGATSPVELPFAHLGKPKGVAVDAAGNVYVADWENNEVLKLAPGDTGASPLPLADALTDPKGAALDRSGNLYVAAIEGLVRISPDSSTSAALTQDRLSLVDVAADSAGNIYVLKEHGAAGGQVLKLTAP